MSFGAASVPINIANPPPFASIIFALAVNKRFENPETRQHIRAVINGQLKSLIRS
jgi:hypothetical protein